MNRRQAIKEMLSTAAAVVLVPGKRSDGDAQIAALKAQIAELRASAEYWEAAYWDLEETTADLAVDVTYWREQWEQVTALYHQTARQLETLRKRDQGDWEYERDYWKAKSYMQTGFDTAAEAAEAQGLTIVPFTCGYGTFVDPETNILFQIGSDCERHDLPVRVLEGGRLTLIGGQPIASPQVLWMTPDTITDGHTEYSTLADALNGEAHGN